tara:strand:+ start:36 stop:137 length:102 start_codon:yes stop_codon:yes gene_type:complete
MTERQKEIALQIAITAAGGVLAAIITAKLLKRG